MTVKKMGIFHEVSVNITSHNEGITVQRGKVKDGRARMETQVSLTPKLMNPNSNSHTPCSFSMETEQHSGNITRERHEFGSCREV